MKLTVVIVSYNCYPFLVQCIESILAAKGSRNIDIFVFDNASQDSICANLPKDFPDVRYEFSKENSGFAKANNRAIAKCNSELVLLLNPDTLLPEDFFDRLLDKELIQKDFGIIGVQMVDFHGNFHQESKRRIPGLKNTFSKLFGFLIGLKSTNYYHNEINKDEQGEVEILAGACMLIKRLAYLEVSGFDERYFMYGEDVDLSYTFWQKGFRNIYNGKAVLLHYKGQSSRKDIRYFNQFFNAMHIFITKYYWERPITYYLLKAGTYLRYVLARTIYLIQPSSNNKKPDRVTHSFHYPKSLTDITNRKGDVVLTYPVFSFKQILFVLAEHKQNEELRFWIKTPKCKFLVRENEVLPLHTQPKT